MTDRAGLAKIPQQETAIKCPRCDSTNTKFCYFNNYSLSQPRHFCKTCRRYWSRGGALRNVPVGGGCRRNKKIKNTSSGRAKSCTAATAAAADSKQSATAQNGRVVPEIPVHHHNLTAAQPQSHMSSLMATLQSLSGYGNIGVNLGGMHPLVDTGDHHGTNMHHFPLLENNLLANSAMASRVHDQIYGVKMEENVLKRPFLGFVADHNSNSCGQFWGDDNNNNYWTDFSSLNNSSAGTAANLL